MIIRVRSVASITIATRKITLSLGFMKKHITTLDIRFKGALNETLRSIWMAFWMLDTSVVILVTRPAVEYLSMSENENLWILRYMASLRLAATPVDEYAANRPARIPNRRLRKAIRTMYEPYL